MCMRCLFCQTWLWNAYYFGPCHNQWRCYSSKHTCLSRFVYCHCEYLSILGLPLGCALYKNQFDNFRAALDCLLQPSVVKILVSMVRKQIPDHEIWIPNSLGIYNMIFPLSVYMDMGTDCTATSTITFAFATTTSTTRQWEVKVSQITCYGRERYEFNLYEKYISYNMP